MVPPYKNNLSIRTSLDWSHVYIGSEHCISFYSSQIPDCTIEHLDGAFNSTDLFNQFLQSCPENVLYALNQQTCFMCRAVKTNDLGVVKTVYSFNSDVNIFGVDADEDREFSEFTKLNLHNLKIY